MKHALLIFTTALLLSVQSFAQQMIIGSGASVVSGTHIVVNGDSLVNRGAIRIKPHGVVHLTGNLKNYGTSTHEKGSNIILYGSGVQTIGGSNPLTFSTLSLNNPFGILLEKDATVNGLLSFQSGKLTTNNNTLTLGDSGSFFNASYERYVEGRFANVFSNPASKVFPIGKGGNYLPVTLQFSALTGTGTVTAEQFETTLTGTNPANATISATNRHWEMTQTGASAMQYYITLDGSGFFPLRPVVILKKDTGVITAYQTTTPNFTNTSAMTTFSEFGFGEACVNPTDGGSISGAQTVCLGASPTALTGVNPPTGHTGTLEYQWLVSLIGADTAYSDIANSNTVDCFPGPLSQSSWYRRLVRVSCKEDWSGCDTSNVVKITVRPIFTPGAIKTAGETICIHGDPAQIGDSISASGGDASITYRWQSSTNAGFTGTPTVIGTNAASYDPPSGLTVNTWFRRQAKDSTCNTSWETSGGVWKVTVNPLTAISSQSTAGQSQCLNSSFTPITVTAAGTNLTYQWYRNTNATNTGGTSLGPDNGAQTYSYTPQSTTAANLYYYCKVHGACGTDTTSAVSGAFVVYPASEGGAVSGDSPVCTGDTSTLILSGNTGNVLRWQSAVQVSGVWTWSNISNTANITNYTSDALSQNMRFRAVVKSGSCATATSSFFLVTVNPVSVGGTVTSGQTICSGTSPANLVLAGNTGNVVRWEKSTDDQFLTPTIIPVTSTTLTGATIGNLTDSTYFRAVVKSGACQEANSSAVLITIDTPTVGGIVSGDSPICAGDTSELNLSGETGTVLKWQSAVLITGVWTWSDIPGTSGLTAYTSPGLSESTRFRALVQSGVCAVVNSVNKLITVKPNPTFSAGSITTPVCHGEDVTFTAEGLLPNVSHTFHYKVTFGSTIITGTKNATSDTSGVATFTGSDYDTGSYLFELTSIVVGGCTTNLTGQTANFVINPLPTATISGGTNVCTGASPPAITFAGADGTSPYIFTYTVNDVDTLTVTTISGNTVSVPQQTTNAGNFVYKLLTVMDNNGCEQPQTGLETITVEPTPVSGTLAKLPNQATVCEGTNVAAMLTAGAGGNLTDSTYSRTKASGSWSSWTAYNSAANISTTGKTEVEVRTKRKADACTDASWTTVHWNVDPSTAGGSISGGTTYCTDINSTLLTLTGHTGNLQKWQSADNSFNWSDIASVTTTTYTANNVSSDTWYRVIVKSGLCQEKVSDSALISIGNNVVISGYAKYGNNPKTPLNGMKILLSKDNVFTDSTITTLAGYYEFDSLQSGNYALHVKSAHPSGQWQTWSGVNNTDYLLVNKHIAGTQLLPVNPPVVQISASTKLPHPLINTTDATAIRQAAKFPLTGYSYFDTAKWVFSGLDAAHELTGITLDCDNVTRDIMGLCSGDVNGTYLPPTGYKTVTPGLELVNRGILPISDEILFPVRVERDMELGAITLMLDYDPSQIEITGVEMPENGGVEPWFEVQSSKFKDAATLNLEPETLNILQIGWMSMEPVRVENGETLLLIRARLTEAFQVSGVKCQVSDVKCQIRFALNDNPLSELADGEGNVISGAKLTMPTGRNGEMVKWRNGEIVCYPNPVKDVLNVEFVTDNVDGKTCDGMSLQLVTMHGVVVAKQTVADIKTGMNKTTMDLRDLPNGAYMLKVYYEDLVEVRKVIINR